MGSQQRKAVQHVKRYVALLATKDFCSVFRLLKHVVVCPVQ